MAIRTFLFQDSFESGDASGWDVAADDTSSQIDFPHYTDLARVPGMPMPYRGAYCMRLNLATGNTDNATIGDGSIDIATGETVWVRFAMYISSDIPATLNPSSDQVSFVEFREAGGTVVMVLGALLQGLPSAQSLWRSGTTLPSQTDSVEIILDKWITVEIEVSVDTVGSTGSITAYVTQEGQQASLVVAQDTASLNNSGAVGQMVVGLTGKGTLTGGTILYDDFVVTATTDANRIYPIKNRFSTTQVVTGTSHLFLGQGTIDQVRLIDGGSGDSTLELYDSDIGEAYDGNKKLTLQAIVAGGTQESDVVERFFLRGCYAVLSGTGGEALVTITRAPNWFSDGNIRRFANQRSLSG